MKPSGSGDENTGITDNNLNNRACLRSYMLKMILDIFSL